MSRNIIILLVILTLGTMLLGADRPIRIETKMGVPNLLGGSVEYVLPELGIPMVDNALAPFVDISVFNIELDATSSFGFSYFGFGAKYYFDQIATDLGLPDMVNGSYAALGFGRMGFNFTDDAYYDWIRGSGRAEGSFGVGLLAVSMGKRWMLGPLTGTFEFGKTLGAMDDQFEIDVKYDDGTSETDMTDTSDIPVGTGVMLALTIGLAF